jgi:hypothetical protein
VGAGALELVYGGSHRYTWLPTMFKKGSLVLIGLLLIVLIATSRDALAKTFGCVFYDKDTICIKYV